MADTDEQQTDLYGLSEAELAQALTMGLTPEEYAAGKRSPEAPVLTVKQTTELLMANLKHYFEAIKEGANDEPTTS